MKVGDYVVDADNNNGIIIRVYEDKQAADVEYDYNGRFECWELSDLRVWRTGQVMKDTHYQKEVQPIDLIEAFELDFNAGNVIKYVARAKHKGSELDDLRKAKYYLDRLHEKAKDNNTSK